MTSSLQQRVHHVARHARQLVQLYGIGWFVTIVCLAVLAIGCADYLLRFEDRGTRFICFALLCLVTAWAFTRYIITAWQYRCSELQAAHHIERRFPALEDQLTSAVAFAGGTAEGDELGSVELRRSVVRQAEAATKSIDFSRCIDRRQPMRALLAAAISMTAIVILSLLDGPSVALAARRMLVPWSQHAWPRRHVLRWVDPPTRLAVGQDFAVQLTDAKGAFPDRVDIHYWFNGDDVDRIQTFPMQQLGDKLTHRLASVARPFRYRATGGDDQTMPWTELELVEPPRITERELMLHPPAYTGIAPHAVEGSFRALVGTGVTLRARTSKPLSAAQLETDTLGGQTTLALKLDRDQLGFTLQRGLVQGGAGERGAGEGTDGAGTETEWTILQSGVYGLRLIDQDGLDVGVSQQWDVSAVRDLPPTVSMKQPAADLLVTPSANLALEAIVKDDLAVRRVALHYVRSVVGTADHESSEMVLELWAGPMSAAPATAPRDGGGGTQQTVGHSWDLARLAAMKPGEWIDFRVSAVDYKEQVGESVSRRLTIISPDELEERIGQRQSDLLAQIAEIVQLQRETRSLTSDLAIQVREVGNLAQSDVDQLQLAELNQRQVQQRLGHPSDGIAARILNLLDQARNNRIDNSELLTRLRQFHHTIQQLNGDPLAAIQHQMIDATRIVRASPTSSQGDQRALDDVARRELVDLFGQVEVGQQRVIKTLEDLLGQLEQWDSYQRLAREVGRLKREQETVGGSTQQLRVETLSRAPNDFTSAQRAQLKRLTQRQNDVALRFDSLASSMEVTQQRLLNDDPSIAATLANAIEMIRQDGISGQMRDVGREMSRMRLGQAVDGQVSVVELLGRLQAILANRRQHQLDRKVDLLRDASNELGEIQARQQAVQEQADGSQAPTPQQYQKWEQLENELAEQVERLANELRRQGATAAESALSDAGNAMRGAGKAAEANDLAGTQQRSRDASESLDAAQQTLKAALEATQNALRDVRIKRLQMALQEFLSRQQRLVDETLQADGLRSDGEDSHAADWDQAVLTLATEQQALSAEVGETGDSLADIATFAFAVRHVTRCMESAGKRLSEKDTGQGTVQLQQQAVQRLEQMLGALVDEVPQEQEDPRAEDAGDQPAEQDDDGVARYVLAQLKLIRTLQQQVNLETKQLEASDEPWNAVRESRRQDLVLRQRQLAELVAELMQAAEEAAKPDVVRPPTSNDNDLDALDQALEQDKQGD